MKRFLWSLISFLVLMISFSFAQTSLKVMDLPKLERYITDFTNTLTTDELNELEAIAENYEEKTTNQLVAVVITDRQGRELFDIGMKIFNDNGIGTKNNNGLLLLIANNEKNHAGLRDPAKLRGIRIIVWYSLEDEIPDLKASQIIEDSVRPLVNEGKLFEAIKAYYVESQKAIDESVVDSIWHRIEAGGESSEIILIIAFVLWRFTGSIIRIGRPLPLFDRVRKQVAKSSLWWIVLVGMGILWIIGGAFAVGVYLFGVGVGLGIVKVGNGSWGGRWSSSWGGWSGGRMWRGFSGGGGRSGGGGAGD